MLDLLHHCDASLEARDCAAHSAEALSSLRLQAYEEVARALRGEPMSNVVNREFL